MKFEKISDLNGTESAGPMQLLLVDDEPRILSSLLAVLSDSGYGLMTAANGLEAVRCLSGQRVDLVILDLQLPDFSGHEVMDFMHARGLDCDVIVTSGSMGIDAAIGALKRGAFDYLRKPYSREELHKAIDNAARQRRLRMDNLQIGLQLEHSERMYRDLVDSSPDLIFMLDSEGRFSFVNARVQYLLGCERDELLGRHFFTVLHEEDIAQANYALSQMPENQRVSRSIELRVKSRTTPQGYRTFSHELVSGTDSKGAQVMHGVSRDVTDRNRADALILYQAYHDILTELPNRVLFKDRLDLALVHMKRNGTQLAVVFIDLDRFKAVNDTLGHAAGDELLRQVTSRLKDSLRSGDTLARWGGDEFTVVLPGIGGVEDAARIAGKFVEVMSSPFELEGQPVRVSASMGLALAPQDGTTVHALVRHADLAMYHQKTHGKSGYALFTVSMADVQVRRIALENELHLALERNELEMFYQPQVDAMSGSIVGVEALMRWNHPQRGLLAAGEFVPMAEESGLIVPMTDWMIDALGRDWLKWSRARHGISLSLNLSPQYLEQGHCFDKLRVAIERYAINPAKLEVEVTENICMRNLQVAVHQLESLCRLGVRVAIDDFGTGYSSLSYLHRFPIHTIKIDRSFITEIKDAAVQYPVVLAIISIARGLGLKLVAEGVETQTQERYLQKSGCAVMQGYLYHRPMPCSALMRLLA